MSGRRLSAADRVLALLWTGGAVAAAGSLVSAPWPLPLDAGLVAHLAGMLAGYLTAVMVVLMSRAPLLEREVGSDVLARWHSKGGRVFLILLMVHAGAALQAWAGSRQQDLFTALVTVLGLPGLVQATLGTALFALIAGISIRAARRKVSHETWHGMHLLTYVAISLSFVHELAGPNLAGHPLLQVAWTLMHFYALALVLRFRFLRPLENAWQHRLRVAAVVPEADGVVSVIIHGRQLEELGAEAGQFFRWRFLTPGLWRTAHPFSLSAPRHGNYLRITVKALGDGSGRIQSLRPGTHILAEGPSGAMTARRRTRSRVLLVAGGVGITPMRALFETLPVTRAGDLTLLYRASTAADVVFRRELEDIAVRRGADIIWMVGSSSLPQLQLSGANLTRLVPDLAERDVYLCASPGLSAAARAGLRDAGLTEEHLHEERFTF